MKNTIILLSTLFLLFSCKEKFNPNEFKGTWVSLKTDGDFELVPTITFQKDSIFLEDIYLFNINGKFNKSNNSYSIYYNLDTLNYEIIFKRKDSTINVNGLEYEFWENRSYGLKHSSYELLNLKRELNITPDSLRRFENGFHIFKNNKDSIRLKINDRVLSDYNSISSFVMNSPIHFDLIGSVVYLGEGIKLRDLIKCYSKLYFCNRPRVMLITDYSLKTNLYGGFTDRFHFWNYQLKSFFKEKTEIPKLVNNDKTTYLKKYIPKIITINSENNFDKLANINFNNYYLVKINSEMSIEEYINLKENILKIKRNYPNKIRTEFFNIL